MNNHSNIPNGEYFIALIKKYNIPEENLGFIPNEPVFISVLDAYGQITSKEAVIIRYSNYIFNGIVYLGYYTDTIPEKGSLLHTIEGPYLVGRRVIVSKGEIYAIEDIIYCGKSSY